MLQVAFIQAVPPAKQEHTNPEFDKPVTGGSNTLRQMCFRA